VDRSDPAVRLRQELAALDRAYSLGHHGLWSVRRRADLLDGALRSLFQEAGSPPGVALAAVGGYGRGQLLPHSDVDLLIVHDGQRDAEALAAVIEPILYPLWDAGLDVGQAVRTPLESVDAARERLEDTTAVLDLRFLAGDASLAERVRTGVSAMVRADPAGFAERLGAAAASRHERYGSTADLLEPELKEGAGGLRDIASIGWMAAASGTSLEDAGLLRPTEREALQAAEDFLTRVRSALHLETGRRTDRLLLERQPAVARAMGFTDEPRLIAEDGLMRSVFEHARQVAFLSAAVHARALGVNGAAAVPTEPLDAAGVLDALATAAEADARPSPALLDALQATEVADPVVWSSDVRGAFLRLLRSGDPGVDALETLDRLGLLTRYLPAWEGVRCRPQRDPYHRFSVDTHLTTALRELGRMLRAEATDDAVEREAVRQIEEVDGVLLGALLHDIGKVGTGGHVTVGARIAQETLEAMGVSAGARELASFMVAQHLLLPDTATRRDLTDDDLILDVAAAVGSPDRLAALYLLAKADAAATGPAAWTSWRRALIRELVAKVQRFFDRGEMGTELAEELAQRIGSLRDLLSDEPDDEVERFVLRMPRGYFLSVDPVRAAAHYATVAPDVGAREVRTTSAPGTSLGTYELLVVAGDRPGLLSWIAGALALAGLSILTAQVFTTEDGVAADLFEVEGAFEPEVGERRWRAFRTTLREALEGQISLERRVSEQRRHYPPGIDAPVTVTVDNEASDFFTVIEVGAPDRIGLLHDITAALAELRLDVHLAKVATFTGRVIDAFYVRDALGGKVTDLAQVGEIEAVVHARLDG
jgi:[protein-PII] uridylyltransferase